MSLKEKFRKLFKKQNAQDYREDEAVGHQNQSESNFEQSITCHDLNFIFEIDSLEKMTDKNHNYIKKIQKFQKTLAKEYLINHELITIFEYSRLIKQIIFILELTRDCTHRSILDSSKLFLSGEDLRPIAPHCNKCNKCREAFSSLTYILFYLSYSSRLFRIKFEKFSGTQVLTNLLKVDENILFECMKFPHAENKRNQDVCVIVKNILLTLQKLSKSVDTTDTELIKRISIKLIEHSHFSNLHNNAILVLIFLYMAKHMNSSELNQFQKRNEFVLKIIELIKCLNSKILILKSGRMCVDCDETNDKMVCVYQEIDSDNQVISLIDLLECVHILSAKEALPLELVKNLNLIDDLKLIAKHGNEFEVEYALKVVFSFSFESNYFFGENDVVMMAKSILVSRRFDSKKLINCCKGIIWLFETSKNKIYEDADRVDVFVKEDEHVIGRIMFSFDLRDLSVCHEIEKELEQAGHRLMRVKYDKTNEPSLEQIFSSIKNCNCVLLCKSFKF